MSNSSDARHRRFTGGSELFDKLIVSEPDGDEVTHRRNYFLVSTVVVGVLFITGVVISIYAAHIDLGTSSFAMAELVSPLDLAATEAPRPPKTGIQTAGNNVSDRPTRTTNLSRVDEPTMVPTTTSSVPNTEASRPNGAFTISKIQFRPRGDG